MNGSIIILDGSPSVGKSTIACEIQQIAQEPYYYFSIDEFVQKLPARWIEFTDDLTTVKGIGFQKPYDLEIDTSKTSAREAAIKVLKFVYKH